ncbi:ABC transporter ATP-binding protein [Brevirhabdus sp.]|uniref:ABC transporter ATP-binding protein n=1 Tax=Brevirhabdus sp. TaxID=2004514 RepID=UPI00405A250D
MSDMAILTARSLKKYFKSGGGVLGDHSVIRAVDDVSLDIREGETFAIVGESGCGKSTLARLLMRLLSPTDGSVIFAGQDIGTLKGRELTALRRDMQFIFQDPFSSLNPRMSVGRLIGEPLETHFPQMTAAERRGKVAELLGQVGLRAEHAGRYPHEFSGGQRQRIGIARALASAPRLVIGDEPVSALDVSVQAQVINLLGDLRDALGLTLVIIAHDLAVIRHMSDRVAVMYLGQIVEQGPVETIFDAPRHPYTRALLSAIPVAEPGRQRNPIALTGEMPSPANPPKGCRFHTRCPFVQARCRTETPALRPTGAAGPQMAACHFFEDIASAHPDAVLADGKPRSAAVQTRFAMYHDAMKGLEQHPVAKSKNQENVSNQQGE